MKWLKRILFALLLIVLALGVVSFFLPSRYAVERSAVIHSEAAVVYSSIVHLKDWSEWSAWTRREDPTLVYTYEGPESGVGAIMKWDGKKMGTGSMEIVRATPNELMEYDLSLDRGTLLARGSLHLEKTGSGTKVTWQGSGNLGGNPVYRYFGLMMDRMLGAEFEKGLNQLKDRVEKKP